MRRRKRVARKKGPDPVTRLVTYLAETDRRFCLLVHHDEDSWVECYLTRKQRGRARKRATGKGFFCETMTLAPRRR